MKASEFENIIRKIIREEIASAMGEKQTPNQNQKNIATKNENQPLVQKKKPVIPKIKTGNAQLDQILSETSIEGFTSIENQSGKGGVLSEGVEIIGKNIPIPATDINNMPVNVDALPESLLTGLTRNYSALLKKADKIASKNRPL